MATATMPITGDPAADELLVTDPLALVIGMLLDQQVPMEWAFKGPSTLRDRLGRLDATAIAAMPPEELEAVFREKPALHRYPASMAKRTHALCVHVVEEYDGDARKIWNGVQDPQVLFDRIRALPGYGDEKAKIFLAILGKRLGVAPAGWEQYAGPFGDPTPRSVADIDSREAFTRVRAWKKEQKAQGEKKSEEPTAHGVQHSAGWGTSRFWGFPVRVSRVVSTAIVGLAVVVGLGACGSSSSKGSSTSPSTSGGMSAQEMLCMSQHYRQDNPSKCKVK